MAAPLRGRNAELARIAEVVRNARAGHGEALVLVGERGAGKSALLAAAGDEAEGMRVRRVHGVAAEKGLRLGGLRRLFGAPDVPGGPVLCLVDDTQWLDEASVTALAFAARRCGDRPLGFVFTAPDRDLLPDLPQLVLPPLPEQDCLAILGDHSPVSAELAAIAAGNPADLLELAGELTPAQRAGRDPAPEVLPVAGRQRARLRCAFAELSDTARLRVLAGACEPAFDVAEWYPGLVRAVGDQVRVASRAVAATLRAEAAADELRAAHRIVAETLDPLRQRVSWLWHDACARGDAAVADELAEAAAETRAHEEAARGLSRAAELTEPGSRKADRLLAAAQRYWSAGLAVPARRSLRQARAHATTQLGRILLLQGEIEMRDGDPALAVHDLSSAAERLPAEEAATASVLAAEARRVAGHVDYAVTDLGGATGAGASLLAGMAAMFAADVETGRRALWQVVRDGQAARDARSALWASEAAMALGRPVLAHDCAAAAASRARIAGADPLLPPVLVQLALTCVLLDRPRAALTAGLDGMSLAVAAGQRNVEVEHLVLAALAEVSLGDRAAALARLEAAAPRISAAGLGRAASIAEWVHACVELLDERPADALRRLVTLVTGAAARPMIRVAAAPQLVEAAIRCEELDLARRALKGYEAWARSTGTDNWHALAHRCHALLAEDFAAAERHFRLAIDLHRAGGAVLELARTELFYARRLRRERKTREAREQLRDALRLVQTVDATYWEDRVRTELRAAGDSVARAEAPPVDGLTPQQERIAHLVAAGETNREIAGRLLISQRTVEHHLRNIFVRLNVRSRVELAGALTRAAHGR